MGDRDDGWRPVTAGPGVNDFDFLFGEWQVHHRRLVARLAASDDWASFEGTTTAWPILGGAGNMDDNVLAIPSGTYRATSLRTFDAATGRWSIWWLDGRAPDQLDPPVVGGFEDGIGTFQTADTLDGRPILVRFRWTDIATPTPAWEQAFSGDDGVTWEINWTMAFSRQA